MPAEITIHDEEQPLPDAYRALTRPRAFTVVRRWSVRHRRRDAVLAATFAVATICMAVLIAGPDGSLTYALAPVPFGGLCVLVFVIELVNRTFISADGDALRIQHRPFRGFGDRELPAGELAQIFCVERDLDQGGPPELRYDVYARLKRGPAVLLLRGLRSRDQALFLEQALEQRLGIEDEPVEGELPR